MQLLPYIIEKLYYVLLIDISNTYILRHASIANVVRYIDYLQNVANICPSIHRDRVISISFPFRISKPSPLIISEDRWSRIIHFIRRYVHPCPPLFISLRSFSRDSNGESSLIALATGNKETSGSRQHPSRRICEIYETSR